MTEKEMKEVIFNKVNERVTEASNKIQGWDKCRQIFESMTLRGYGQEMMTFRNLVLYSAMIHPDWTEDEVLEAIYKEMNQSVPMD